MIRLETQRILVVDDEMDNLKIFQATMEMLYNVTVETASSVEQAMTKLDNFHPTLIVTDLSMPRVDGYGLLARLRERADTAALPVVALTAHAMSGDRERILAAGFDGYLSKPFDVTRLGPDLVACLTAFEAAHSQQINTLAAPVAEAVSDNAPDSVPEQSPITPIAAPADAEPKAEAVTDSLPAASIALPIVAPIDPIEPETP